MAEPKKKKEQAPPVVVQSAFDAKASSTAGEFVMWAFRHGEKPATSVVLTRKNDVSNAEKGIALSRADLAIVRALIDRFEQDILPRLDAYGLDKDEEE